MPSGVEPHGSGNLAVLKGVPVLIVEDSWHVAKALKLSLEELEMRVIGPTGTVAQARQFAVTQKPRLAVVDVNLEDGIATDFIAELYRRGVQVIVVTGYEFPPILADKTAAFIQKPYSGRQLISAMCEILDPLPANGEGPDQFFVCSPANAFLSGKLTQPRKDGNRPLPLWAFAPLAMPM